MTKTKEQLTVFSLGAVAYSVIELLWRKHTHWSMGITGGLCFSILYNLYHHCRSLPLVGKCLLGSGVITTIEFIVGMIVNVWQKWNVWDYSDMKFNLLGQVCALYSSLWFLLCIPIVLLSAALKQWVGNTAPQIVAVYFRKLSAGKERMKVQISAAEK